MEDDNIFLRAAFTKSFHIPTEPVKKRDLTIENGPSYSYSDSELNHKPPNKAKTSNDSKRGKKLRSTQVENVLVGEGFRKYGRDSKATVNSMIKHRDILDDNLQMYYESVGRPGGPTMNKAMDRVRRLQQKKLEEARTSCESLPKNEKIHAYEEFTGGSSEEESESAPDAWGEAAETTRKKDTRFTWPLQDSLTREDVMASIKTKTNHSSEDESTERTCLNKKEKGKRKRKQSTKERMDNVLASLPELIMNSNQAAKDHSECLKKLMGEPDE